MLFGLFNKKKEKETKKLYRIQVADLNQVLDNPARAEYKDFELNNLTEEQALMYRDTFNKIGMNNNQYFTITPMGEEKETIYSL